MQQDDRSPQSNHQSSPVGPRMSGVSDRHPAGLHAHVLGSVGKGRQFIHAYQNDKWARTIIHAVLAANCCLIVFHVFLEFVEYFEFYGASLYHQNFLVTTEGGYPEMFNYLQLAVLAWLMLHVFVRTRQAIYASLGAVSLLALGEDALQLHERVGLYAASIDLPAPSSLGAHHFGEFLQWLVVGALSAGALVYGLVASSAEDRKIGAIFVLLIFMLGFLAAVVDAAHIVLRGKFFASDLVFGISEDGGEMLVIALALSAAVLLDRHLDGLRRPPCGVVGGQEFSLSRPPP